MPKRDQLLDDLSAPGAVGVFLMCQMDGVPETLQLVVATAALDEQAGGLREKRNYVIRAIGVIEHQISVGLFSRLTFATDHPLLYQYNDAPTALFFRGQPDDINSLLVDMLQAYASTFGPWRQIPDYLNLTKPLHSLLTSGGDLLGQMPGKLAAALNQTLQAHRLETRLMEDEALGQDEHGRSQLRQALMIDDSYVIALDFSVDLLGRA